MKQPTWLSNLHLDEIALKLWSLLLTYKEMRLSYLPPLMVYAAAGISGLTAIVGTFYVKEKLGLSAEFLTMLGFWVGLPWVLKMPIGHLVDLLWRWKSIFVILGAGLIGISIGIMVGLLGYTETMLTFASVEVWYVTSVLLAPIGYVLQDIVADAMTVEAVPRMKDDGSPQSESDLKRMHTTMQTFGRMAIIGGGILVSVINIYLMAGVGELSTVKKAEAYLFVYQLALTIPFISMLGVILALVFRWNDIQKLMKRGHTKAVAKSLLNVHGESPPANWVLLGGGLAFAVVAITVGLSKVAGGQEIVFLASLVIILFLMRQLLQEISPGGRKTLVATAILIFVYRAMPGVGPGIEWWQIDELRFDQEFFAKLSFIGSTIVFFGMLGFKRFMAERSMAYILGFLTIAGTLLSLPTIGMFYGLHNWTAGMTGGIVDARFLAIVDTAISSPLGQVAMIPMLAWIANSAPEQLKATFFAVMASFTNLALSASTLSTKYLNQIFVVTREVRDPVTSVLVTPANYGDLGTLLILSTVIGFIFPMLAIWACGRSAEKGAGSPK